MHNREFIMRSSTGGTDGRVHGVPAGRQGAGILVMLWRLVLLIEVQCDFAKLQSLEISRFQGS